MTPRWCLVVDAGTLSRGCCSTPEIPLSLLSAFQFPPKMMVPRPPVVAMWRSNASFHVRRLPTGIRALAVRKYGLQS